MNCLLGKRKTKEAKATTAGERIGKEAREYDMTHARRGQAVVFNQNGGRAGSEMDCQRLEEVLQERGFQVEVHQDRTKEEVAQIVEKVSKKDHSDADCVLVVMMCHGEEGYLLDSRGHKYEPGVLWTPFTADLCPSLAGKPKIVLLQACQGEEYEGTVAMTRSMKPTSYRLPHHADFLIASSTIAGKYSIRNTATGAYFIQAFCRVLQVSKHISWQCTRLPFITIELIIQEEGNCSDLLSLLTEVSRAVATEKAQIPCVTSMLTRKIFISNKN